MNEEKEVTVEIRESGVSIQSPGIGNDTAEVREILQTALDALDNEEAERETYKNEVVVRQ